ncbi:SAF domain-containing protein [Haloactinomyces albus]|uniref:Flp pilus assembly protein CpaB n=1 Tax=Haloactinomyces albus TaxID=1352928 RepID=A0AAE3ZCN3_9ACTN|nr:SAF domain-containing protein [Haloactinomyces albus]MDR7301385.1 Flp pilus assembly protein CpaB [Haloactinomyces albus]
MSHKTPQSHNTGNGLRLDVTVRDRLRGILHSRHGVRMSLLRRVAAVALILVAGVLALRPHPGSAAAETSVLVAARDLAAGTALAPDDVRVRTVPKTLVPAGTLRDTESIRGRVLAGAMRRGGILTDLRLVGKSLTRVTTGSDDHAAVAIRPADPAVAELLHAGREVDVIAAATRPGEPEVLAERVPVLAVHSTGSGRGGAHLDDREQLVVVGLPQKRAAAVASATLTRSVTVTLR